MNLSVKKRYCECLHSPKNVDLISEKSKYIVDDVSQKYFETVFRIDPVDGHLISDVEVMNDSSTPAILKDYIQQHTASVIPSVSGIPNSLVDKINPFDFIENVNAQSPSELVYDFQKKGIDVSLNSLD